MQSMTCITKRGNLVLIPVQAKPNSRISKVTEINSEYVGISIAS